MTRCLMQDVAEVFDRQTVSDLTMRMLSDSCKYYHSEYRDDNYPLRVKEAKEIMDYYASIYLMKVINQEPITKFQQDLLKFCTGALDGELVNSYEGLAYSLPHFYYYDKGLNEALSTSVSYPSDFRNHFKFEEKLSYVTKMTTGKTRDRYLCHYLFSTQENYLVIVPIDTRIPFNDFFDDRCNKGLICISGHARVKSVGDKNCLHLGRTWQFVDTKE